MLIQLIFTILLTKSIVLIQSLILVIVQEDKGNASEDSHYEEDMDHYHDGLKTCRNIT